MTAALTALFFGGSRESWLSFAIGVAAGLVAVLISKRLRRREGR